MLRTDLRRLAITLTALATLAATAPGLLPTAASAASGNDAVSTLASRGPITIEAGQPATITVVATDATGQPVTGATPSAQVDAGVNASGTSFSCRPTEFDGTSLCTYLTSPVAGSDIVKAWIDLGTTGLGVRQLGEPQVTIDVTSIPQSSPGSATARVLSLSPSTAEVPQGTWRRMSALVIDAAGDPVVGIVVRFDSYGQSRFNDGGVQQAAATDSTGVATAWAGFPPGAFGQGTIAASISSFRTECGQTTTTPAGVCFGNATLRSVNAPQPSATPTPTAVPSPTTSPSSSPSPSPAAPVSSLTVLPGDSSALVTWQPPAGDAAATSYIVWYGSPATGGMWKNAELPASALSYLIDGVTNGVEYVVEVYAVYATGEPGFDIRTFTPAPSGTPLPLAFAIAPYDPTTFATATTSAGSPTTENPVVTTVQVPAGATGEQIVIQQTPTTGTAPAGYTFFGQQIDIDAPVATPADPLVLTFQVDSSRIPAGSDPNRITLVRSADGPEVTLSDCADSSGTATPDPCIASRTVNGDGDVTLTVLTSHASRWNTALANATPPCGAPARAGNAATSRTHRPAVTCPRHAAGSSNGVGR